MKKRGISPLIATTLIVGFTIILAVVVINWARTLADDVTSDVSCEADANKICRNMPPIPVSITNITSGQYGNKINVKISNTYSRNLSFLLVVRTAEEEVLGSSLVMVENSTIYSTHYNHSDNFLFNGTYLPGNALTYTIILPYTTEEGTECESVCFEEELTVR